MHSYQPKLSSPSHSEWGLINNLKQKQYEEALRMQKLMEYQKKQAFRSELQNQLRMKQNGDLRQKQEDKAYYNFIVSKTHEEQSKSVQQKYQKYLARKSIDENNRKKQMEERSEMNSSRFKPDESVGQEKYLIGFRDEASIKAEEMMKKQAMFNGIQQQLREKQMMKKHQRMNEIEEFHRDIEYQNSLLKSQQSSKNKFRQNEKVYQFYSNIYQKKQEEKNKLEYSLVEKPLLTKMLSQDIISQRKPYQELMKKQEIKDALDQQIDEHRAKQMFERHPRPEEVSYSFFGSMFNQASKGYGKYDKKEYNQYLQKQMLQQKENKKKFEFMDQREYLYNINQINKALNGSYLKDTYQDCSIANVGEKLKLDTKQFQGILGKDRKSETIQNPQYSSKERQDQLQNEDQKLIRSNLQQLLKKNSTIQSSTSQKQSPFSPRKSIH